MKEFMKMKINPMKAYKATTINGEPKLEPVNPYPRPVADKYMPTEDFTRKQQDAFWKAHNEWMFFRKANPPIDYIGPAIPDGTILDESEVEIVDQRKKWKNGVLWNTENISHYPEDKCEWRRVATLKAKEPVNKTERVIINRNASDHNTWLAPYYGKEATLTTFQNGDIEILIDGEKESLDALGSFISHDDWDYTIHDIVDVLQPSNSEEGEQPMKEESQEELWLKAIDFIEVFADGVCNIHKHAAKTMVKHGWILTKK